MKPDEEQFKAYVNDLQQGYRASGRMTRGNERLALLVVLVAVTKRSIPEVISITRDQFKVRNGKCRFRGLSPRAKIPYYIEFSTEFYEYLMGYCERFHIAHTERLFDMSAEYAGNRFRELQNIRGYHFGVNDIKKIIPFSYGAEQYKKVVQRYVDLLYEGSIERCYFCHTGSDMSSRISDFFDKNDVL